MKKYWIVCLGHINFDMVMAHTENEAIEMIRKSYGDETLYLYYEKYRAILVE